MDKRIGKIPEKNISTDKRLRKVVKLGDYLNVFVRKIDKEKDRILLGINIGKADCTYATGEVTDFVLSSNLLPTIILTINNFFLKIKYSPIEEELKIAIADAIASDCFLKYTYRRFENKKVPQLIFSYKGYKSEVHFYKKEDITESILSPDGHFVKKVSTVRS